MTPPVPARTLGVIMPLRPARAAVSALALATLGPATAAGQTTGRILGRVFDAETEAPVAVADVLVPRLDLRTLTSDRGLFVLAAVPAGTHVLRVERIGYRPFVLERVEVRAGRVTEVEIRLRSTALELEGLVAEIEWVRLIEPEVTATHELTIARELRDLPLDEVEEAIELTTGVTDGHFRGGRVGQEVYVLDGFDVKNPLEASTGGFALEVAPSALEEIEVVTGGFGAQYGSALSGIVRYATRRGSPDGWEGRAASTTDQWAPDALFRGFTGLSVSACGPVPPLGERATVFADLLVQGMLDADPRARGLTCLRPEDADAALADRIRQLVEIPSTAHLYCPYSERMLPHQEGDKLLGFLRFDRPLFTGANLTVTVLHNRRQQQLYTSEFKYNRDFQLGQRARGTLAGVTFDWAGHRRGRAFHLTVRTALVRLDRYLGVVDRATLDDRAGIAGFGFSDFEFLGEDFVRSPLDAQLESARAVPGYREPGGSVGSPFGPAAEGIFFTEGTPEIANWTRTDYLSADVIGELLSARGHAVRVGVSGRAYRIASYERVLGFLAGSAPNFARFFPRTLVGFAETSLAAADDVTVEFGVRVDGFRSGLDLVEDRGNLLAPAVTPGWRFGLSPRLGVAIPIPGTEGRTAARFNYGLVVQPPDFRFFLDTTIGDSLRTDIERQGNPDLAFERGTSYEVGVTHLVADGVAVGVTGYLKELSNLVTGSLSFAGFEPNQFTTGDFGSVRGVEGTVQARWPGMRLRAGYALQEATGVTSGPLDDPDSNAPTREEFPLAFDRRHAADLSFFYGRAAGDDSSPWSLALTGSVRSGTPLDRALAAGAVPDTPAIPTYLPWTGTVDLRVVRELGRLPGCGRCRWRAIVDGRNVLGRDNVIALRRDSGRVAPPLGVLQDLQNEIPSDAEPIPRESPRYSQGIDLDLDGLITAAELRTARFAAALDRHDPSLFYGEARRVRLGVEVTF